MLVAAERVSRLGEEPQEVTTVLLLNHPVLVGKETVRGLGHKPLPAAGAVGQRKVEGLPGVPLLGKADLMALCHGIPGAGVSESWER